MLNLLKRLSFRSRKSLAIPGCLVWLLSLASTPAAISVPAKINTNQRRPPNANQSLTVYFENDLFDNTDRYYTNGVRISWLSQDLETLQDWPQLQRLKKRIPGLNRNGYTNNIGLSIGQNIYTPENTHAHTLQKNDRPYAGWLYGSISLHHKNQVLLHKFELTLGIIGPAALGKQAQNGVHTLRNLALANGWENQLKTEPGMIAAYDIYRRYAWHFAAHSGIGGDLIPNTGISLGNVLTEVRVGAAWRIGWNTPANFYGNSINALGYVQPPPDDLLQPQKRFSCCFFTSVTGHAVARNIFLDGNSFRTSHRVDKIPLVGSGEIGVGIRWKRLRLTYSQIWQTRQFHHQNGDQRYGSIALTWGGRF